jgi:hypothetical protein
MSEEERRLIEANVLREFAHHELHSLLPHADIATSWYHYGLDQAQAEALRWAIERDGIEGDGDE